MHFRKNKMIDAAYKSLNETIRGDARALIESGEYDVEKDIAILDILIKAAFDIEKYLVEKYGECDSHPVKTQ